MPSVPHATKAATRHGRAGNSPSPARATSLELVPLLDAHADNYLLELATTRGLSKHTLDAYARAAESNDIVVGPLARPAVAALASSGAVSKPTIALNHPQVNSPLPRQMLVIGLSLEDEARQVADWAAGEQPVGEPGLRHALHLARRDDRIGVDIVA